MEVSVYILSMKQKVGVRVRGVSVIFRFSYAILVQGLVFSSYSSG